ncbi:MAG TPA: hypothetical protein VLI93_08550, partial [Acetobacteraceae bacterium]|nr:hypothetical protein [Acetobacteraceae bacterium]
NTGSATLSGATVTIPGAVNAVSNTTASATNALTIGGAINTAIATLTGATITIPGTVSASNANLTAGAIDIAGRASATQSLTLTAAGSISETGVLVTPLLTGSAGTTAALTGVSQTANQIGQINGFSAGQQLTVNDGVNLLLSGRIAAPLLVVNDSPAEITLANGAVIATGGVARPRGIVLTATNNPIANHAAFGGGAYLTDFTQLGTSTITGIDGGPSILGINATAGHHIRFDPVGGLRGPTTWLVLQTTGSGTISGNVFVGALDVLVNGIGGSANLFGTVAGVTGVQAAGAGNIAPTKNANFRFNSCAIGSVNCVLLPAQAIPVGNPLDDFSLGAIANPNDEDDLLLPVVSDEDY